MALAAARPLVLLLAVFLSYASAIVDHYAVLRVRKNAGPAEIKKAYRKLARTEHPDKKPNDPKANQKFAKINTAYEVLSNPEKKREYDQQRSAPGGFGGFGGPGFGGGGFGRAEEPPEQKFSKRPSVELFEDSGSESSLAEFQRRVASGFWLVLFYDNEGNTCKRIADAVMEAADSFHGLIRVLAILYSDEEPSATPLTKLFNVERTGSLFLYSAKKLPDLSKPAKFVGDAAKGSEISKFAANAVPYPGMIVRDHMSLQRFLLKDEGRPKLFLISDKWSVPLMYKLLAAEFGSVITLGVCRGESSGLPFLRRYDAVKRGGRMPILLYFKNGDAKPEQYHGMIALKDIRDFLTKKVGTYVGVSVTDHNSLTRFLIRNDARPKMLLVTSRADVPLIWKGLSSSWKGRVDFAASRVNSAQSTAFIMKRYKVKQVPTILFFANGDAKPKTYEGVNSLDALQGFLRSNVRLY